MHYFAIFLLFISFFGIPVFLLVSIIQFFRGRPAMPFLKICVVLVPVFIIGTALGEFTTPNYWERNEQTEEEKEENRRIQENINKNWAKAEEEQKKYEQARQEEMAASLRTPEQMMADAYFVDYDSLQNDPDSYIGEFVKFEGVVNEVREEEEGFGSIIALDVGDENLVRVDYILPVNYQKGDIITVFGTLTEMISYTNNSGEMLTAPILVAKMIK